MTVKYVDKFILDNEEIIIRDSDASNKLNKLIKPKYLFIGDSYANRTQSWMIRLIEALNLSQEDYVDYHIGGSGFTREVAGYGNWQDMMENAEFSNKEEVKYIIVCGGANDRINSQSTISTAISNFMTSAKQNYPNAKVYIGFIGWCCDPDEYPSLLNTYVAYSLCNSYGAIYLNGVEMALHRGAEYFEDRFHPNTSGQAYIFKAIYQAFISGSYDENLVFRNVSIDNSTRSSAITNENLSGKINIYHSGHDDIIQLKDRCTITGTFNNNTWYELGCINNTFIFGVKENTNIIDAICIARDTTSNAYNTYRIELQIFREDFNVGIKTHIKFRIVAPTLTFNSILIGGCKITLNSMTQD